MRRALHIAFLLSLLAASLIIAGCGGTLGTAAVSPATTPNPSPNPAPTPTPTPTPAPTPTPTPIPTPTPTPTPPPPPGTNPDMFQAALMRGTAASGNQDGQIQVNAVSNNGAASFTLTSGPASTTLTLEFCPFNPDTYGKGGVPCYTIDIFTTDASGNAEGTFTFPKKGVMFGSFQLRKGTTFWDDFGYAYADPNQPTLRPTTSDFHASLQRASTVTDVNWSTFTLGNDSLTSGNINVHGSMMAVNVTGAMRSSDYMFVVCPGMTGSSCYESGHFTTDVSGNASQTIDLSKTSAGYFNPGSQTLYAVRGNSLEFVAGFKVE